MATYYVDGSVGNDSNAGTSAGAGNAWATIQKGLDTVAAGDKVWVKASATYNEALVITTTGSTTGVISFEGYTSTTGDKGFVTNDGTTGSLADGLSKAASATCYYTWRYFKNENFSGFAWDLKNIRGSLFHTCEGNSCNIGWRLNSGTIIFHCAASNNTGDGFTQWNFGCSFFYCRSHGNGSDGFNCSSAMHCYRCIASSNAATGFSTAWSATSPVPFIIGCTVDGDADDTTWGLYTNGNPNGIITIDNIFYDCAGGLRSTATPSPTETYVSYNNLLNANTTDYSDWDVTTGDVTGSPDFTDETTQDYTLQSTSSAINAGYNPFGDGSPGQDIGAHQSTDAGGGGGAGVSQGLHTIDGQIP